MSSRRHVGLAVSGIVAVGVATSHTADAPRFSDWSAPVHLVALSSTAADIGPAISKDGRSLYFSSNRSDSIGDHDIYVSQRASVDDAWGTPINIGEPVNTTFLENVPAFSRDGHWMFFNSNRPGSLPGTGGMTDFDIWASWRADPHDDFSWEKPVHLGEGVNSHFFDAGAGYYQNETGPPLLFFGSERPAAFASGNIWVSARGVDGSWGEPTLVAELTSQANESRPNVRFDGLEIFLHSNRTVSLGVNDLWVATRKSVDDPWSAPVSLGPVVNSAANDVQPYIASDRRTLYFASTRSSSLGDADLYVTTRTRLVGAKD